MLFIAYVSLFFLLDIFFRDETDSQHSYIVNPICYLPNSTVKLDAVVSLALSDTPKVTKATLFLHEVVEDKNNATVTKGALLAKTVVTGSDLKDVVALPLTFAGTFTEEKSLGLSIVLEDANGVFDGTATIPERGLQIRNEVITGVTVSD